ncbi:MAG: hypothetical protein BWK80_36645 [Desulfobacteraceae bacterium IS3]|nr:MAG: hypothetical protein BWK80_36645 [Desulfobacteraceae bacterium IS3]
MLIKPVAYFQVIMPEFQAGCQYFPFCLRQSFSENLKSYKNILAPVKDFLAEMPNFQYSQDLRS